MAICHTEHVPEAGRWPLPVHAASAPGSWWRPGSAAGAAFHPRPWEVWAVPGRQRWSQGLLSLSLILLSVSRGGPGPCL